MRCILKIGPSRTVGVLQTVEIWKTFDLNNAWHLLLHPRTFLTLHPKLPRVRHLPRVLPLRLSPSCSRTVFMSAISIRLWMSSSLCILTRVETLSHPRYTLIQVFSKFGKLARLDYLFHKTGALRGKPRGYAFVEYTGEGVSAHSAPSPSSSLKYE